MTSATISEPSRIGRLRQSLWQRTTVGHVGIALEQLRCTGPCAILSCGGCLRDITRFVGPRTCGCGYGCGSWVESNRGCERRPSVLPSLARRSKMFMPRNQQSVVCHHFDGFTGTCNTCASCDRCWGTSRPLMCSLGTQASNAREEGAAHLCHLSTMRHHDSTEDIVPRGTSRRYSSYHIMAATPKLAMSFPRDV